ncbi:selenide, water dikinase SelD [Oceanibium sediminis]|uniref:selenide, water dikinase SelD n=1 Tax=Oceanibium sediminis TaxID=2026339 RepID=UPI000DD4C8CC|nr:selenide, water dikinase SelD [Oceanibium sediminis]
MQRSVPLTKDLVLLGGGHSHALVLRAWGMDPVPGVRVTLINPAPTAPYTGMLPGHVAGHYPRAALDIDLARLARFAGARLVLGAAEQIDPQARTVSVPGRPPIRYDRLSIDIGIHAGLNELPGFAEHGVGVKPLDRFADRWVELLDRVAASGAAPRIAVIGGGIAGSEIALAMAHRLRGMGVSPSVQVIDTAPDPLGAAAPGLRRAVLAAFAEYRIETRFGDAPVALDPDSLRLASGQEVATGFTVSAAGARPHEWLAGTGLPLRDGYLPVDSALRVLGHPEIYATGDCAHLSASPRPKAGVYAVRAAPVLHHNLRADLTGRQRRAFRPQKGFLKLVSLGAQRAAGERFGLAFSGPLIWRWKDRIDRRFMERFSALKPMAPPPPPERAAIGVSALMRGQLQCMGCGAKVAQSALLPGIGAQARDIGDDAALLDIGGHRLALSTDHLPAFTEDPLTFARIAATHALGDIWATGAAPRGALVNVILPRMEPLLAQATLGEVMQGLASALNPAGAPILGGHTTFGAELTLGVTVLAEAPAPKQLTGARPGDVLVLTKPIGSGTLLAGDMALKTSGADLAACLALMGQSQARAAEILSEARAMTDVTGFGLAGHLANIARASGVSAHLELANVPVMAGALALAESGLRSTLYTDNVAGVPEVAAPPRTPRAALLFDPQTAGGLLATLPPENADAALCALTEAGYMAALIGRIADGPPRLSWG